MKYAREVIDLMAAYPGRDFRMVELVRYAGQGRQLSARERQAMRVGISRVLAELSAMGSVLVRPPRASRGGFAMYRWRSDT